MSVEAFARTLYAPVGGTQKVLLLGLANHAAPDGTSSYPAVATLAEYARCDTRTVQRNLRRLEEDGFIEDDGTGTRGQRRWRILFEKWGDEGGGTLPPAADAGVASGSGGVASETAGGGTAAPSEPSIEPSNRNGEAKGASTVADSLPDDFPDELKPHARVVFRLLREVAEQHGAREVKPLALGRAMMGRPRKPFVKAAHDFASWAADPPRPIRDVVASYRTWLDREKDLQATEKLSPAAAEMIEGRKRFTRKD